MPRRSAARLCAPARHAAFRRLKKLLDLCRLAPIGSREAMSLSSSQPLDQPLAATAPKSILVVEDDATVRGLIKRVLSMRGFVVHDVADGRVALDVARTAAFDLVITDLVMPEVEGLETIRLLKRDHPSLEILAVSGAYGGAFLHAAELLGARATLAKPFDADTLLATVERIVGSPA
jgi:CheY-like chemotaxis protein